MLENDINYYLDPKIIKKLDLMSDRCTRSNAKKDACLIVEGGEGEGKTNTSIACAYYVKKKTGMPIHLFFRLDNLIKFAQTNTNCIIIWDEPALDALSTDSLSRINKDLIRLLMAVRINRHFFIFNFTKFYKFNEYIVVDRALGLIHMYSRKEIEPGRFVYIKKRNLEKLYLSYKQSKKRLYKKYSSFRGSFSEVMNRHFDSMGIHVNGYEKATINNYESEKSKAIEGIGKDDLKKENKALTELRKLKRTIGGMIISGLTREELAAKIGISSRTLQMWKNMNEKGQNDPENANRGCFEAEEETDI